jgi:hypothetical protein
VRTIGKIRPAPSTRNRQAIPLIESVPGGRCMRRSEMANMKTAGASTCAPDPADSAYERVSPPSCRLPETISFRKRSRCDWIRTRDVLNPIIRVKVAPSRRISQVQAFWRLTDSTLHTLYADHSRKSMNSPHFPDFSVPERAHFEVIGTDGLATSKRHASRSLRNEADGTVELARPCDTSVDVAEADWRNCGARGGMLDRWAQKVRALGRCPVRLVGVDRGAGQRQRAVCTVDPSVQSGPGGHGSCPPVLLRWSSTRNYSSGWFTRRRRRCGWRRGYRRRRSCHRR